VLVLATLNTNVYGAWNFLGYTARTTTPALAKGDANDVKDTLSRDGDTLSEPVVMYGYHSKNYFTARPYQEETKDRKKIESNSDITIYDQFFPGLFDKPRKPVLYQESVSRSISTTVPVTRTTGSVVFIHTTEAPGTSRQSSKAPVTNVKYKESPAMRLSTTIPDDRRPPTPILTVSKAEEYEAMWQPSEPIGKLETKSQMENNLQDERTITVPNVVDSSYNDESQAEEKVTNVKKHKKPTGLDSEPAEVRDEPWISGGGLISLTDYSSSGTDNMGRMFRTLDTETTPRYCNTEKKVNFVDKCEPYKERTCHSVNRETCHNREIRNCSTTALVSRVEEQCLNTTDIFCTLVEDMKKVDEEEVILEESCEEKQEEVCDYMHKVEKTWVEEEQCVEIDNNAVNCKQENTSCDVGKEKYCDNTPSNESGQQEDGMVGCEPPVPFCRNVTSQHAKLVVTEICHDKPITVCRMNEVIKPVSRQKFTYKESCTMVPKIECKMVERMKLEAKCVSQSRPVCQHHLQDETCKEEEKEYCYQAAEVEEVEVCDDLFQTEEV